jgi:acyl-CoA reductase-like NAD-dependent aldehyde dehydrogenase
VICTPAIHAALVAQAASYLPGDGLDPQTRMGPVVSVAQLGTDLEWLATAAGEGAELKTPEPAQDGQFLSPAVFTGVHPTHRVAQEEVFGPLIAVMHADEIDDATGSPTTYRAPVDQCPNPRLGRILGSPRRM